MTGAGALMTETQRLRDRIEELERVLGVDRSLTSKLRDVFGLEPGLSPILGMLMQRIFVSHSSLYTVLYANRPECDWPEPKILDVQICKLRRKLKKIGASIDTRWGEGWMMTAANKAKVRDAIGRADASAAAAAMGERRAAFVEGS